MKTLLQMCLWTRKFLIRVWTPHKDFGSGADSLVPRRSCFHLCHHHHHYMNLFWRALINRRSAQGRIKKARLGEGDRWVGREFEAPIQILEILKYWIQSRRGPRRGVYMPLLVQQTAVIVAHHSSKNSAAFHQLSHI